MSLSFGPDYRWSISFQDVMQPVWFFVGSCICPPSQFFLRRTNHVLPTLDTIRPLAELPDYARGRKRATSKHDGLNVWGYWNLSHQLKFRSLSHLSVNYYRFQIKFFLAPQTWGKIALERTFKNCNMCRALWNFSYCFQEKRSQQGRSRKWGRLYLKGSGY